MVKETYVKDRLDNQIEWYDKKSQWCQKRFKFFRITEIIISSTIPVTAIFSQTHYLIKLLTAILGSSIAIIIGIQSLYKFHENWLEYRTIAETLKHEKYLFETKTGIYDIEDDFAFKLLVERIESIISHENINWSQINSCAPTKKGQ